MVVPMSSLAPSANGKNRVDREVTVLNKQGIHARPSASFVKLASTFTSDVFLEKDGEMINGKSIMGLLMLAAGPGSRLRIICEGTDCDRALAALVGLFDQKFGED